MTTQAGLAERLAELNIWLYVHHKPGCPQGRTVRIGQAVGQCTCGLMEAELELAAALSSTIPTPGPDEATDEEIAPLLDVLLSGDLDEDAIAADQEAMLARAKTAREGLAALVEVVAGRGSKA